MDNQGAGAGLDDGLRRRYRLVDGADVNDGVDQHVHQQQQPDQTFLQPPDQAFLQPPDQAFLQPPDQAFLQPPDQAFLQPPDQAFLQPPDQAFLEPPDQAFLQPPDQAFLQPPDQAFLQPPDQAFLQPPDQAFLQPPDQAFLQPPDQAFLQPPDQAFLQPPDQAFLQPPDQAFLQPPDQAFLQPPDQAFLQPPDQAFLQPPDQAFLQPPDQAFLQPPDQAFLQPPDQAFLQPPDQAFLQPPDQAFLQPPDQAFLQPPDQAFLQPPDQAFLQPPAQAFLQPPAQAFLQQPPQAFLQPPHPPPVVGRPRRVWLGALFHQFNFHQRTKSRAAIAYSVIGIYYLLMGVFVLQRMNSYPEPKNSDNSLPHEFREENARRFLEKITSFGPRVSGSEAHVQAEQYILEVIQEINASKLSHNAMEVSLQVVSGGLIVDFTSAGLGEFSSVYQNLKNIVVKVSPPQGANTSLLVNCHYDSVVDSPGAGDDAASCAVMLEILRAISHSSVNIMHNIIFLFNGAGENMLQTSHGFITEHAWASSVKAFINLDSAGAGGWEIVFQTGPGHPWLIKAYIEAAPYPHASVLGQEIFQTGVILVDTDFRIFRDYGNIPGIAFAHIKNGYVYHMRNDISQFIPPGCLQRGGENIMATTILLANSSKLTNPGEDEHGSMVFFDYLGFFMVAYPSHMAMMLNLTNALTVYMAIVKRVLRYGARGAIRMPMLMLLALLLMYITWIITLLVPLTMALLLDALGHSLSYYTYNLNVIWLFILPSVTAALAVHLSLKKSIFKKIPPSLFVAMLQESNLMLWSVVLMILTDTGVMSAYMPLMFIMWPAFLYTVMDICGLKPTSLLFNLLASLILSLYVVYISYTLLMFNVCNGVFHGPDLLFNLLVSLIPSLYVVYISYTLLMFIIPILGRTGMEASPDVIVAVQCGLAVMVCLPYHIGFVYSHAHTSQVLNTTVAVILLGLTSVIFTPAGFPYSDNPEDPSPQRAVFVHFDRRFYSHQGLVVKKDAYIWYKPFDRNRGRMLEIYAPEVFAKGRRATCDGVYCGRPYLYPILSHVDARKTYDFPASHLQVPRVTVEQQNRTFISDSEVKLAFNISGPSHVTIFISGFPYVRVKNWTCSQELPVEIFTVPNITYPTYFIYYSHSGSDNTTWQFSISVEVEASKSINSSLIRIGFAGHYLYGPYQVTPDLIALEQELPGWMLASRWSATYDEYVF